MSDHRPLRVRAEVYAEQTLQGFESHLRSYHSQFPHQREGQALINALSEYDQGAEAAICGGGCDPFYNDSLVGNARTFLYHYWHRLYSEANVYEGDAR
jgi:hypothetical protein